MATNSSIFFSRITANGNNSSGTSFATASVAPVSGQFLYAVICSLKATTPDTPTASGTNGFSGTWHQIGTTLTLQTPAGNFIGVSRFWSIATSSVAGVLTFSFGAATQLGGLWDLLQSPFVNATTPVVQSNTGTDTSSSTALPSITLSSALSSFMNWSVVVVAEQANSTPSITLAGSYQPYPNQTATSIAGGLGLKLVVVPGISFTPASGSYTASVAKVITGDEIAQDGTGVPSGGGLLGNDGFQGGFSQ